MIEEKKGRKIFTMKKSFRVLVIIIFILFMINIYSNLINNIQKESVCGDGTLSKECSLRKPYFCESGILIEKAYDCNCPELLTRTRDSCVSKYQTNPKNVTLKYVLRGEEKEINFTVYQSMADYLSKLSRSIYYYGDDKPSHADFKLKNINEPEQRELLLPLLTEIQNIAESEEDQMRIAVSLVQNIPFGQSGEVVTSYGQEINYSRYPYEVLYDHEGVCGEKSELLAFLLREMGYGVVFFYHQLENHESIGIKCPLKYSLDDTGYCFIETTGPSIITDSKIEYNGIGKLYSKPEVIFISDGNSLGNNLYEYKDVQRLISLRDNGVSMFSLGKLKKLKEKYGLSEIYRAG